MPTGKLPDMDGGKLLAMVEQEGVELPPVVWSIQKL